MMNSPKILAIIPARGGSKGVPRKNIKLLVGKPLIAWTIEEAKKSKYISKLILSSEDDEIINVAKEYDCEVPFKRPIELAQDNTPGIDTILHAIKQCPGYDYIILLQPTSPLRTSEDIDDFISYFINQNVNACVSVCEPSKSPYWMYQLGTSNNLIPLLKENASISRRQDLPKAYALNGALYIANIEWIKQTKNFVTDETVAYVMPVNRSYDIDTIDDFQICEYLLEKRFSHE
ncbi:cytidylyltransferase domain-containing protein [Rummeliibacillus suwonensis]|uniref:acylneuraminate cytidylyltransferase family protein n=1 Tax=Rummeliibacillus suwonensis TaxID=1306154 RepID=UPI001AAF3845|nr:acylneuraminate cytidylyltransferase family protein [Rummeliibacillus suwonensis]MBO2534272.1 acylneuraminate cytidylyltransferase family protein [Rummeliibacillus suwonensis]